MKTTVSSIAELIADLGVAALLAAQLALFCICLCIIAASISRSEVYLNLQSKFLQNLVLLISTKYSACN